MYQQDWIMRQVQMIMQFILHRDENQSDIVRQVLEHELDEVQYKQEVVKEPLYFEIMSMLNNGEVREAESILRKAALLDNKRKLLPASVEFYANLSQMDEEFFKKNNYSKEEIGKGFEEILEIYRIV